MFNSAVKIFQKIWEIINNYQILKNSYNFFKTPKKNIRTQNNTKPNFKIDVKMLFFWFFLMHVRHVVKK